VRWDRRPNRRRRFAIVIGERPAARASARQLRSIPTELLLLAVVAVLVVPGIIFTGLLLTRYSNAEIARYEAEARDLARHVTSAIDRDLSSIMTTLQTLGNSARLQSGDYEGFYSQALRLKALLGVDIVLRRQDGQQLINTRLPWGTSLPQAPIPPDAKVLETKLPLVSDVFESALTDRPLVAVIVPVAASENSTLLLNASIPTERIANIAREVVAKDWLIGIGDRAGVYVARTEQHDEFTGKPAAASFIAQAKGAGGAFEGKNAYGKPVLVGYARSDLSGWLIAANIPQDIIRWPLQRDLILLVSFGAAVLALSSYLALVLWRFVSAPLRRFAGAGDATSEAAIGSLAESPLREIAAVGDALRRTSRQLNERERERDEVEAALRASEIHLEERVIERTRELHEANQSLVGEMERREQAETQVRQLQRIEAVGQLTGGIAHDFNNMLAIVISALNLSQRRMRNGDTDIAKYLEAALEGAKRAAVLTSRLLAFSRQQPLAPASVDTNKFVSGMSELLMRTLGDDIRIETVLAGGLWRTHVDAGELENAILNLAVNARDAMPEGGKLTIETANCFLDEAYAREHAGATPGQYVMIAVSDSGEGMPQAVAARAFEPFFTTKDVGKGTGLGLSQVYGFVKQSGGHVKIYSEVGQGTTVKIYLPRFYGPDAAPIRTTLTEAPRSGNTTEIILVVEDEDRVRQLTVDGLRELGYTVVHASNAAMALRVLDEHPDITLLFTDIIMPDMNGRRLADEACRRRPELRVLFTTGFTRNAVVHNGVLDPGINFLQKPYSLDALAEKVREALGSDSCESIGVDPAKTAGKGEPQTT
jgi:signal transduction histidine kinase/CheY-like chemotaxis protein